MCGSTLFLLGARTSSGASTGRPNGSANRKHKYSVGGVRPVVSHESEEPRRSNTPGSFLGKRSQHPRQSCLIGLGGGRLASSRPATRSVSEAAIGIPLLFCAQRNLLICSLVRSLLHEECGGAESHDPIPQGIGTQGFFVEDLRRAVIPSEMCSQGTFRVHSVSSVISHP